jgi:hypothetical protein
MYKNSEMIRFWYKSVSCFTFSPITIRYKFKVDNAMWSDNNKAEKIRTGVRIVR